MDPRASGARHSPPTPAPLRGRLRSCRFGGRVGYLLSCWFSSVLWKNVPAVAVSLWVGQWGGPDAFGHGGRHRAWLVMDTSSMCKAAARTDTSQHRRTGSVDLQSTSQLMSDHLSQRWHVTMEALHSRKYLLACCLLEACFRRSIHPGATVHTLFTRSRFAPCKPSGLGWA